MSYGNYMFLIVFHTCIWKGLCFFHYEFEITYSYILYVLENIYIHIGPKGMKNMFYVWLKQSSMIIFSVHICQTTNTDCEQEGSRYHIHSINRFIYQHNAPIYVNFTVIFEKNDQLRVHMCKILYHPNSYFINPDYNYGNNLAERFTATKENDKNTKIIWWIVSISFICINYHLKRNSQYTCYFIVLFLGPIQRVTYMCELKSEDSKKVVQNILDEWTATANLYNLVKDFSLVYNGRYWMPHTTCIILWVF